MSAFDTVVIAPALLQGVPMYKISSKKIKQVIIRLTEDRISWAGSKSSHGTNQLPQLSASLRSSAYRIDTAYASKWITVVYVRAAQWKVLHMIALTSDVYELWVSTLKSLVSAKSDRLVSQIAPSDPDLAWIRQLWPSGKDTVDLMTAITLARQIGLVVPDKLADRQEVRGQKGDAMSFMKQTHLDLDGFSRLIKAAHSQPEITELYNMLTQDEALHCDKVERFLTDHQGLAQVDGIFSKYAQEEVWTMESLRAFLESHDNFPMISQDLTLPLQHYFISSSHNTYLVGEQWRGESTVEGYIRVLLAKCRCVEIDCHDGATEPVAYHSKSLTTKVAVRDIFRAIAKYAFVTSPYPVIISAEVRCTLEQQERLAEILMDIFGSVLVSERSDGGDELPGPEALKGRILFKAKPRELVKGFSGQQTPESHRSPTDLKSNTTDSASDTAGSDKNVGRLVRQLSFSKSSTVPFAPSLARLLVYTKGVKYRGFSKLVSYASNEQFSLSERNAERIIREGNQLDWIKHNFSHISRVYPKGLRMTSTNFDPLPFWASGCQLVALNWQTVDLGLALNHAMFEDGPGYVLKPLALRSKLLEPTHRFRATDLFVRAALLGGGPESLEYRTKTIKGTSINPYWNATVDFVILATPSTLHLTFIHLEIRNPSLLAQWIRPVARAPTGYHYLPLHDPLFSKYVFASIFVDFQVDDLGEVP